MDDYTPFYLYIVPDTVRAHESSKPKGSFHELSFARSERCARSDLKFIRVKSLSSNEINRKERHDIRNKSQAKLKRKNLYGISIIVSCPLQKMHVSAKSLKLDTRHMDSLTKHYPERRRLVKRHSRVDRFLKTFNIFYNTIRYLLREID